MTKHIAQTIKSFPHNDRISKSTHFPVCACSCTRSVRLRLVTRAFTRVNPTDSMSSKSSACAWPTAPLPLLPTASPPTPAPPTPPPHLQRVRRTTNDGVGLEFLIFSFSCLRWFYFQLLCIWFYFFFLYFIFFFLFFFFYFFLELLLFPSSFFFFFFFIFFFSFFFTFSSSCSSSSSS